ncbi:MAG: mechanosensitive ion channel [Candidatus Latescibacteria bacterium]|nr:mechanosensitive ion channel [Candidatus Latescibacterota bacterium]
MGGRIYHGAIAMVLAGWAVAWAAPATPGEAEHHWARFLSWLFQVSSEDLERKLWRVAIALGVLVGAKVFMDLVQWGSRRLMYARWGLLNLLFGHRQRSITLLALFISIARYVVYFTALGYILSQFGIDYRAYMASLSLVGIALGFGSQGLVQDVVTGFFILFEDQFSVGDMVEIGGQVGIVEEIGLRTVKLRNYFGAQVIFSNRNIPMVARYRQGAFEVGVDVALADPDKEAQATRLLGQLGTELERQFREVMMGTPTVEGLLRLETGEYFLRLRARIWPAQQWVIDNQLVPRIQELFTREGLEIPANRVVAFYHFPEDEPAPQGLLPDFLRRG